MTDTLPDRRGAALPPVREEEEQSANFFRGLVVALVLSLPLWVLIGWFVAAVAT